MNSPITLTAPFDALVLPYGAVAGENFPEDVVVHGPQQYPSPPTDLPMVRLAGVSKRFEARGAAASVAALDDVSLDIPRGGISSIIGRSGAGKSTLVRLLNGLERPTTGEVIVDGVDIARLDGAELRAARRAIGMVFQHFNLLSSRTAYDNVALPLELQGLDSRRIRARVEPLLDLVGLADKRDRYPAELSGGQKQRVGIARALATEPKLLLSDEATSALDPETTRSILELLARINREFGLTIALITHEMDVVKQIASRVAVLDAGRIVEQGDVFDLFSAPQHEVTRAFLGADRSRALPAFVAGQLHAEPRQDSRALVRITFAGEHATAPVISRLARILGVDVAILQGEVDEIAGRPFGTLLVAFANGPKVVDKVRDHLAEFGLTLEHLGYVA